MPDDVLELFASGRLAGSHSDQLDENWIALQLLTEFMLHESELLGRQLVLEMPSALSMANVEVGIERGLAAE